MIHLDRNHHPSTISKHSNPNLILPTTHTDQLKLLSRSPLTRDDKPVHQEHQERPSNTSVETNVTRLPAPPASDAASVDETVKSHSSAPPSPRAETPGNRSSSLTPPPESASPRPTSPLVEDKAEEETSRQSTPLSELSPDSEQDDSFEADTKDGIEEGAQNGVASTDDAGGTSEIKQEKKEDLSIESEQKLQSAVSPRSSSATSTLISPRPLSESDGKFASSPERTSAMNTTRAMSSKSPVKSPASDFTLPQDPRAGSRQPSVPNSSLAGTPAPLVGKAMRLLELNGELLKVCMEFQAQHIPMNDPRFQQYFTRLQANLTWLANVADSNRQGNPSNMTLPIMDPPVSVDFAPMDRINQLYADLPSMFAKEIARRQQMGIAHRVPSFMPPFSSNLSLKRDRSDDIEANIANKRRDTGESKSPPMRPPATPPPPSIITPSAGFPASTNDSTGHVNMSPIQPIGMLSIAPPILPQGMPTGPPTEAQLAASARERTRQMQIQEALRQQRQPQQQQNIRQMSPPSIQGAGQMPGQGQIGNTGPSAIPNNPTASASLSHNSHQNLQILQNPSHPFTQYMNHSVPGFSALPVREQLQRMQVVQSAVQQKQQLSQNQHASSQQRVPMPGISQQQPMQPVQNTGMRPQYPGQNGGVTSPTSQSSAAQQQQSPQNGAFPFAQTHLNPGANVVNPQMMGSMGGMNLSNTTPQQRQLMLLQQQQQQMRTASGNTNPMMTPEQFAMAQERIRQDQRMSQAVSPTNASSPPMSASVSDGNTFPVLRSNTTLPGISRSTLSPSDGTPTPMSPQMSRGTMQDMRRMVNPAMGNGMGGQMMGGQMPGFNQQMANWQQKNQQHSMPMGHLQPPNYGVQPFVAGGNSYGGAVPNQNWPGQYPLAPSPNSGGYQQLEQTRQASSTPIPQQLQIHTSINNSPPAQHTSPSELEIFSWNGQ